MPLDKIKTLTQSIEKAKDTILYAEKIGGKTAIIEFDYVDKDYLLDFVGYYSRSFQEVGRLTTRIHIFANEFDKSYFERIINENNEKIINELKEKYLGFFVIKPLAHEKTNPSSLIGRTILNPPVNKMSKFICCKNKANLFGIPFEIDGLPFQTRDPAVAACATMALWVANNKAGELFQAQLHSPFEITKKAIELIENSRNLPPEGLTIRQMLAFIRNIGLDYNIINIPAHNNIADLPKYKNLVKDAIKAFINGNIPLIADLWLFDSNDRPQDAHSVVISGYDENSEGDIQCIHVHDDRIGPYFSVKSKSNTIDFLYWDYQSGRSEAMNSSTLIYDKIMLNYLIIPIYTKIRLDFNTVYANYINGVKYQKIDVTTSHDRDYSIFFSTVQNYKNKLLSKDFVDKSRILRKSMPRFLWIIATKDQGYVVREDVYDATSHYLREIETINYNPIST